MTMRELEKTAEALEPTRQLKAAYQAIPQAAMDDLYRVCRADRSCWHDNPRTQALYEGHRQIWLYIQKYRTMTPEQLAASYGSIMVPDVGEGPAKQED